MNFSNPFNGHNKQYPNIPLPFLPWDIPPAYPYPHPFNIPPLPPLNPFHKNIQLNYPQNGFMSNSYQDYFSKQCTNPYFEKLVNLAYEKAKNEKQATIQKRLKNKKQSEIIQILDDDEQKKIYNLRVKNKGISKMKKPLEIRRLKQRKYEQQLQQNDEQIDRRQNDVNQRNDQQSKRLTRVSGKIPKDIRDESDFQLQNIRYFKNKQKIDHTENQKIILQRNQQLTTIKFHTILPNIQNKLDDQLQIKKQNLISRKIDEIQIIQNIE